MWGNNDGVEGLYIQLGRGGSPSVSEGATIGPWCVVPGKIHRVTVTVKMSYARTDCSTGSGRRGAYFSVRGFGG